MTSLALRLQVVPGEPVWLDDRDPSDTGGLDRAAAEALFAKGAERLAALQERMFAQRRWAALLVLQGLDASGKDGAIRRLAAGLNPMALHVTAFAAPSALEQAHDFLWRVHQHAPAAGEVVVFNRSHYEDVVAVRVRELAGEDVWRPRYAHIRAFEQLLADPRRFACNVLRYKVSYRNGGHIGGILNVVRPVPPGDSSCPWSPRGTSSGNTPLISNFRETGSLRPGPPHPARARTCGAAWMVSRSALI